MRSGITSLANLDPAQIDPAERFPWQPQELVAVIGQHRQRHWGQVTHVAFHPSGKLLASCGYDGVRLWDVATMNEMTHWQIEDGGIRSSAFTPDGQSLFCATSSDVRLLEIRGLPTNAGEGKRSSDDAIARAKLTLAQKLSVPIKAGGTGLAVSRDGRLLVTGGESVRLWAISSEGVRPLVALTCPQLAALAISPDSTLLAAARRDKTISVWDLSKLAETGALKLEKQPLPPLTEKDFPVVTISGNSSVGHGCVAFSPDSKTLAVGDDSMVRLWDVAPKTAPKLRLKLKGGGRHLAFSSDARWLASMSEAARVNLWNLSDVTDDSEPTEWFKPVDSVYALAISTDNRTLATGGGNCGTVRLWDLSAKPPRETHPLAPNTYAREARFSPDGKMLAVRHLDQLSQRAGQIIDLAGPRPVIQRSFDCGRRCLDWSGDSRQLVTTDYQTARLYDVVADKQVRAFTAPSNLGAHAVAVSPDGKTVATGTGAGSVYLWHSDTNAPPKIMSYEDQEKTKQVDTQTIAFSPDGSRVAVGFNVPDKGKSIVIWDLATNPPQRFAELPSIGVFPGVNLDSALAWSRDGSRLATCHSDGMLRVWDMTLRPPKMKAEIRGNGGFIVSWAPDGQRLAATAGNSSVLTVYSAERLVPLHTIRFPGRLADVHFHPDGQHVATANGNGTAYILRLPPEISGVAMSKSPSRITPRDTDRAAAEWALANRAKGQAMVRVFDGEDRDVTSGYDKLPDKPFTVTAVHLRDDVKVTDAELARYLPPLRKLVELQLKGCSGVSDASLATLKNLPSLQIIDVQGTGLGHAACLELAKSLPRLLSIFVSKDQFSVELGDLIAKTPRLTTVVIGFGTDAQYRTLLAAPHLLAVGVSSAISLETCGELPTKLPNLEVIGAHGSTDAKAAAFARCVRLQKLSLNASPELTDDGLKALHGCASLRTLSIQGCPKITKDGAAALRKALPHCRIDADFETPEPVPE
jgi:WD40 repeat protein